MTDVMAASQVAARVEELIAESRFSGVVRIDRPVRRCWSVPRAGLTVPTGCR